MRVLLVEDEPALQALLAKSLREEKYGLDCASDGEEALLYLELGEYDCVILDIMLPKKDGLAVLREMREKSIMYPVLLLTARDSISDRVAGLDAGADDYLVKPFSYDELSARIRALMRRNSESRDVVLRYDNLSMNTVTRQVERGKTPIDLAAKEYAILEYMLRNPERVLTRDRITEHVWNFDFASDSNIVDVYMRYLRRKMDYDFEPRLIHTVRGVGYVLKRGGQGE